MPLYMPSHSSHNLQPLDVSCFGPLKRAYGQQIQQYMRNHLHALTKLEFLPAFKQAFKLAFTRDNIQSGFRASGLVPYDPEVVLNKLPVCTIPEGDLPDLPWQPSVPTNSFEFDSQGSFISERIDALPVSSQPTIADALEDFKKGAVKIATELSVMRKRVRELEEANEQSRSRKKRTTKVIQSQHALSISEIQQLIAEDAVSTHTATDTAVTAGPSFGRPRRIRTCGICKMEGPTNFTCPTGTQQVELPLNADMNSIDDQLLNSGLFN